MSSTEFFQEKSLADLKCQYLSYQQQFKTQAILALRQAPLKRKVAAATLQFLNLSKNTTVYACPTLCTKRINYKKLKESIVWNNAFFGEKLLLPISIEAEKQYSHDHDAYTALKSKTISEISLKIGSQLEFYISDENSHICSCIGKSLYCIKMLLFEKYSIRKSTTLSLSESVFSAVMQDIYELMHIAYDKAHKIDMLFDALSDAFPTLNIMQVRRGIILGQQGPQLAQAHEDGLKNDREQSSEINKELENYVFVSKEILTENDWILAIEQLSRCSNGDINFHHIQNAIAAKISQSLLAEKTDCMKFNLITELWDINTKTILYPVHENIILPLEFFQNLNEGLYLVIFTTATTQHSILTNKTTYETHFIDPLVGYLCSPSQNSAKELSALLYRYPPVNYDDENFPNYKLTIRKIYKEEPPTLVEVTRTNSFLIFEYES